jgi:hypothetical protein
MKILHIAPEHGDALVAASIIQGIAQECSLMRALTPASALEWLIGNQDTAAVIVEMQAQSCASFIEELRGLGLTTPVVVVAGSARMEAALAVLNSGADGYVVAGPTLEADLSRIVAAVTERERSRRQRVARTLSELRAAAATMLDDVQARHSASLSRETKICVALQQSLFELETKLREADERRASDAADLAVARAALDEVGEARAIDRAAANDRQAALEELLAHETDRRSSLERELAAVEAARQEADRRHASELAGLQARHEAAVEESAAQIARTEADLGARLAEATAAKTALERTLTETQAAQRHAMDRAAADLASAAARQTALDARLAHETERGDGLERQLAAAETARLETDSRHASELTAARASLASLQTTHDTTVAEYSAALAVLDQRLTDAATAHRQAEDRAAAASMREAELADRFSRESDARAAAKQDLTTARMEAARGRDRSLRVVSTYRRWIRDQKARFEAQLTAERDSLHRELDATRIQADELRGVAERVPDLQAQLEQTQNERRRQFERAPYALCRCSPDGAITDANHSFVTLLGCRRVEELRNMDFVSAGLDSAGDLGWLLERARTTRKTESVETHWKTRDGRRLVVRLQALVTPTGSIDIVAEDITGVRALEERLRQAQRMEAVGRLASEVAVTCDALLTDVVRRAHEWLARAGSDDDGGRHAERLLTDVTRAAGFLRQLEMYGQEQVRALEPVSAQRILRDLAPVLKRLVGDRIELVLPKSAGSFNVDVDAERLERVLIIVAGYARGRMPSGGQVRIDLATTAVGRKFVARYSNVRPGDHVLITVTELPAAGEFRDDNQPASQSFDNPGVDLGVLLDLIGSCGGHLWLEAQPAGNMVVKIHLPKPPSVNAVDHRSGRLARWFRSASAANVGV